MGLHYVGRDEYHSFSCEKACFFGDDYREVFSKEADPMPSKDKKIIYFSGYYSDFELKNIEVELYHRRLFIDH